MAVAAATVVALAVLVTAAIPIVTPFAPSVGAATLTATGPLPTRAGPVHFPPDVLPRNAPAEARASPTVVPRGTAPTVSGVVTVIGPNCQISGANAGVLAVGANFTVRTDFTGAILDECNDSGLFGDGYTLTMAANASAAVEVYNAEDIQVSGFLIANATTGILAEGVQGLGLTDNTVASSGYGIEVEYSSSVTVDANVLSGDYGSLYEVDDGLSITGNALDHTEYGAYAVDINGATISDNDCNGSTSAVSVYDSTLVTIWGDNLSHSVDGLYAQDVSGLVASWNNASASEYPLQVYYGGNVSGTENSGPNATVGLTIYFAQNVSFTAQSFPDAAEYGLEIEDATGISVAASDFDVAGFEGVFVGDATDVTLNGDTADHFFDAGVVVSQSSHVSITGTDAREGLGTLAPAFSTSFDQGLTLTGGAGSASAYGLEDQGSLNVTVSDCQFIGMTNGDAGISLQSDAAITVVGNTITNASGDALDAFDSSGLMVSGNTFTGAAQTAMYVAASDGVTLTDNDAARAGFTGLDLEQLDGFTVEANNVSFGTSSLAVGGYLEADASGNVVGNSLTNEPTALELLDSTSVAVTDNNMSYAQVGIVVANTVNCTLAGNEIADDVDAFSVASSEHLALFHNNFVDDAGWALPPSTLQANWSDGYPAGGNYWSNHTQPDGYHGPTQNLSGGDGIVDTPVALNSTNIDPYPLAQPWVVHTITFTESGLPTGVAWSVVINGTRVSGSGPSLVYDQPNAVQTIYDYTVGPVEGFRAASDAGSVAPGNGDATVAVTFVPFEYSVSFQAAGLAAATTWSVTIGLTELNATGGAPLSFALANGSYTYDVGEVIGYSIEAATGPVVVNGAAESITVAFSLVLYNVTFVPEDLPAGASWSVALADSQASARGAPLTFEEANGSYPFTIGAPSGYVAHPGSGMQAVNGTTAVYVAFTPSNPTALGTPLGIALVGAVIALAIVAGVALLLLWGARHRRPPVTSSAPPAAPAAHSAGPVPPPDTPERWRQ